MTTQWNERDARSESSEVNDKYSFGEHNEQMRQFRKSHADVALVNGTRLDEAAYLGSLQPLRVSRAPVETGGAVFYRGITDAVQLAPMWRVTSYRLSVN